MSLARAIALASDLDRRSYYEILGVSADASLDEIDRRYYLLAPKLHPDRFVRAASPEQLRALTRISAHLTEARQVLITPRRRVLYDEGLARGELRLRDEETAAIEDHRDPRTPVARKMFDTALELVEEGKIRQALAKLRVAQGFESESVAIAQAIDALEAAEKKHAPEPTVAEPPAAAPEQAPEQRSAHAPAPAPAPVSASPPLPARPPARGRPSTAPPEVPPPARRHDRMPLSTRVALKLKDWSRFEAFTRNLSLGGVFLKTGKAFPIGAMIDMTFALPDGTSFDLPGRVARCVRTEGEVSGVGVQFLEMPAATRAHIEELLEHIGQVGRPPPEDAEPDPPPLAENDDWFTNPLTLETAVPELLRIRSCPPREALGLTDDVELDRTTVERAYAERSAPLGHSMLTTGEPNLIGAISELTGHLMYARDLLLEQLTSESEEAAQIHDAAPRPKAERPASTERPANTEGSVVMEINDEKTQPRRIPAPLPARPVLAPQSLADLGPRGVARAEDSSVADRIFELIAEGHYEAAIELIARLVPNDAPPRLLAARHIARGYIAERQGDMDLARVEFESALVIDRTSCEAILRLRKAER